MEIVITQGPALLCYKMEAVGPLILVLTLRCKLLQIIIAAVGIGTSEPEVKHSSQA